MTIATVTSKGQTTIPKEVRDFLGLQPQQQVAFERREGYVIMRPVDTSLEHFAGILSSKKSAATKNEERQAVAQALGKKNEARK